MEMELPSLAKHRRERDDEKAARSYTEIACPHRMQDRTDMLLAATARSKIDNASQEPNWTDPKILMSEPRRRYERNETEDPMWIASNTDVVSFPTRDRRRTEKVDPKFAKPRIEQLTPSVAMDRVDMEEPRCTQFNTESLAPNRECARTDRLDDISANSMTEHERPI
jgi:hypothetical protein